MNIATVRANLTLMLSLDGCTAEISDAELDRAMEQATAALSRFSPREVVYQTVYNLDVTAESFTTDASDDVDVTLGNKPIRFNSETVTNSGATVTYVRDTDYELDYINGAIRTISGGGMSASTSHLITYEMDGVLIDIDTVLTEPIEIQRVDLLTAEEIPVEMEGWSVFGGFLEILNRGDESQRRIIDNTHIRIYYTAHHAEPAASTSGSWPRFLDEVMLIGASGFALLIEMNQRQHAAVVDLATARTRLGSIAAVHTAIGTTITDLMTTEYTAIRTSLVSAKAEFALANIQLDKPIAASAELEDAKTAVDLAPTSIAKVSDIIDEANVIIDKMEALLNGATTAAEPYLDAANAELLLANTALNLVGPEIKSATRNADTYLDTGDALINQINTGEDASNSNARFAQVKVQMANTFQQEAIARIEHSRGLVGLAGGYLAAAQSMGSIALSYIREIEARILEARTSVEVASSYVSISNGWINVASGFISNGRGYLDAATSEVSEVIAYINQMQQRIAEAQVYVNEATSYQTSAVSERESAAAFEAEAEKRINTFFSILEDRRQTLTHPDISARQQYARYPAYLNN